MTAREFNSRELIVNRHALAEALNSAKQDSRRDTIYQLQDLLNTSLPYDIPYEEDNRMQMYVTDECAQVWLDGHLLWEYTGPDARSRVCYWHFHGPMLDTRPFGGEPRNQERVYINSHSSYQAVAVSDIHQDKRTARYCHPKLDRGEAFPPPRDLRVETLSAKEVEILRLFKGGSTQRNISNELGLPEPVVVDTLDRLRRRGLVQ